jgi:hypothetical protein
MEERKVKEDENLPRPCLNRLAKHSHGGNIKAREEDDIGNVSHPSVYVRSQGEHVTRRVWDLPDNLFSPDSNMKEEEGERTDLRRAVS